MAGFNESLVNALNMSGKTLSDYGFTHNTEDFDIRGQFYELRGEYLYIYIDAWFEVILHRIDSGNDGVVVKVSDLYELENLIDLVIGKNE